MLLLQCARSIDIVLNICWKCISLPTTFRKEAKTSCENEKHISKVLQSRQKTSEHLDRVFSKLKYVFHSFIFPLKVAKKRAHKSLKYKCIFRKCCRSLCFSYFCTLFVTKLLLKRVHFNIS